MDDTSASPHGQGAEGPVDASHDDFIKDIDFRYQRLFGNVSFVALLVWIGVAVVGWLTMEERWIAILLAVGSALLTLFAMRAVIHARSGRLLAEVQRRCRELDLPLHVLTARAQVLTPVATFFISLVDGPLARERRRQRADATPSR